MSIQPHPIEGYCTCTPVRALYWSAREHAWCHTDGYQCPASADRPAPETAEAVLF